MTDTKPDLSSMSYCQFQKSKTLNLPEDAFDKDLILMQEGIAVQFVSKIQYQILLFILGQKFNTTNRDLQSYSEILTLLNKFPTNNVNNFQDMLDQLQLPLEFDNQKSLAQNQCDFKDFFLI